MRSVCGQWKVDSSVCRVSWAWLYARHRGADTDSYSHSPSTHPSSTLARAGQDQSGAVASLCQTVFLVHQNLHQIRWAAAVLRNCSSQHGNSDPHCCISFLQASGGWKGAFHWQLDLQTVLQILHRSPHPRIFPCVLQSVLWWTYSVWSARWRCQWRHSQDVLLDVFNVQHSRELCWQMCSEETKWGLHVQLILSMGGALLSWPGQFISIISRKYPIYAPIIRQKSTEADVKIFEEFKMLFQAFVFYIPRAIWLSLEGKLRKKQQNKM